MSPTTKPVIRRTIGIHPRHNRRVVIQVGPGDAVSFRLERERGEGAFLDPFALYDQAERRKACNLAGIPIESIAPCKDPRKKRNI